MNKYLTIGIDPDTNKSGVAILHDDKNFGLSTLSFFELHDYLVMAKDAIKVVKIECGYLNKKSSWHISKNISTASKIGSHVGACNEVAKKIVEMCKHLEITYKEVKPFVKIWKNGKISHDELVRQLNGLGVKNISNRTNQEQRDAALICING